MQSNYGVFFLYFGCPLGLGVIRRRYVILVLYANDDMRQLPLNGGDGEGEREERGGEREEKQFPPLFYFLEIKISKKK